MLKWRMMLTTMPYVLVSVAVKMGLHLGLGFEGVIEFSDMSLVLTGGVDSNALQRPKRFFGAARKVEEGGSLTIIATALVDTGSRMDEVIFEEFKGTGNCEIHLDRRLYEKRVFPAIQLNRSGTRREEMLLAPEILQKTRILRQFMFNMDEIESMELMLKNMKATKTNVDFFDMMRRGG